MLLVKFSQNQIYLHKMFFRWKYYLITVGIKELQGHETAHTYLNNGNFGRHTVQIEFKKGKAYLRRVNDLQKDWKGVPIELKEKGDFLNITSWLFSYSPFILAEAYMEYDKEIELKSAVSTEYMSHCILRSGVQFEGSIRTGNFDKLPKYSVEFVLNILPMSKEIMTPRVGDRRIGYFYQEIQNREEDALFNDPFIFIDRRNLDSAPWKYLIERSIPKRFWEPVRLGIEHWNQYFQHLGLGRPLVVLDPEDKGYPKVINVFDPEYNYVVNHSTQGLNAFYTGVSQDFVDFRSGEILFGNIYLNFQRMETIGYRYFRLYQTKTYNEKIMRKAINNCIIWVVGHEIGHQLGLRHNFVGNEMDEGYGSIMDYIEFFDHYEKFIQQDYARLRTYDLHAIKYGYTPVKGEKIGEKPSLLTEIAEVEVPFKTDDHFFNGVIPNVGRLEDERDILSFISKAIINYKGFRQVILDKIVNRSINAYQYANGFLFIYINRYRVLLEMLCKYIGGRYIDFHYYRKVELPDQIRSLQLLLKLKSDLKYKEKEYSYLIYDFSEDLNKHAPVIKVELDEYNYYGFNSTDLFLVFQNLTKLYLKAITRKESLIRLNGGVSQHSFNLLYQLTFCVDVEDSSFDIIDSDGIFPEIGLLILKNGLWRDRLSRLDIFDQYTQYEWVNRLVSLKQSNEHYFIQMAIEKVFSTLEQYREVITKELTSKSDNSSSLLLSHYGVIWEKISKTKMVNYTW